MSDLLLIATAVVFLAAGVWTGWFVWGRRHLCWIDATTHDVSVMPGGVVLHHTTCACRAAEAIYPGYRVHHPGRQDGER